ncbi:hypothetical protein MRX96_005337 [Rhipicephalus microplus]
MLRAPTRRPRRAVNQPRRLFVTDKATNAAARRRRDRVKRKPLKFNLGWQRLRRDGAKYPRTTLDAPRSSATDCTRACWNCYKAWQRTRH